MTGKPLKQGALAKLPAFDAPEALLQVCRPAPLLHRRPPPVPGRQHVCLPSRRCLREDSTTRDDRPRERYASLLTRAASSVQIEELIQENAELIKKAKENDTNGDTKNNVVPIQVRRLFSFAIPPRPQKAVC